MKDFLLQYIRYNAWANLRITKFIEENCSEEQCEQAIISSFPSLKETLLHLWGAESIWLQRLKGDSPTVWKGSTFHGTTNELSAEINNIDKDFIDFAESCGEAFLLSPIKYNNLEGKEFTNNRADAILHCVNHSTYHRGQIITMLRQLGFVKLFSTDYVGWCRERGALAT